MGRRKGIANSVRSPIGCPPLREFARGKRRVLIVTDDNTRNTPLRKILPPLLDELKKAGVKSDRIKILIASGTHRPMTAKELVEKFGGRVATRFKIYNHRWNDTRALARTGSKIGGKEICVNKLAARSDFIIGVGGIVPHATTGFSGGGKIILPGICGEETVEDMHWKALGFGMEQILGVYENPMRRMVDSVAKKVGLKFIVNVVIDGSNRLAGVVAGDPVKAHRKGVEIARRALGLRLRRRADIVVADARPMDIDLRQAIKAVAAADLAVNKGGVIVLKARCPEGVAPQFPEFERRGFKDPEGLKRRVEEGEIKGRLMAYTLIAIGRIMERKAKVILVSKGIARAAAEKMGFLWAGSLKEALKEAKELVGGKPEVLSLRRACEVLPFIN